jgi:hypothetical protein
MNRWLEFDIDHDYRIELSKKAYDVEAIVHTANNSFALPKNGKIVVDSDFVEIEINIIQSPDLLDENINSILHQFDTIQGDLKFDSYDSGADYFAEDGVIRLKYTQLENGDVIDLYVHNELLRLLELKGTNIHIEVTDVFSNAREYFPNNIEKKEFAGGIMDRGFTHNYTYLTDDSWIIDIDDGMGDIILQAEHDDAVRIKYKYDGAMKVTDISKTGDKFISYEKIVLPQVVKLGESWVDDSNNTILANKSRTGMITAIDYQVDTAMGILDTVEVTYYSDDREYIKYYYAKGYGLVYRYVSGYEDSLVEIK